MYQRVHRKPICHNWIIDSVTVGLHIAELDEKSFTLELDGSGRIKDEKISANEETIGERGGLGVIHERWVALVKLKPRAEGLSYNTAKSKRSLARRGDSNWICPGFHR